jgi:hypothetical protein
VPHLCFSFCDCLSVGITSCLTHTVSTWVLPSWLVHPSRST